MMSAPFGAFLSENHLIFSVQEPGKNLKFRRIFLKTGLTKKQTVTELFYNAKDSIAEIHTHDEKIKNGCWHLR